MNMLFEDCNVMTNHPHSLHATPHQEHNQLRDTDVKERGDQNI